MKSLQEYIFENIINIFEVNLHPNDFSKHNYKYIKGLLSKLLNKENVRLGQKGNSGTVNISDLTPEEQKYAEECLNKLHNNIAISEEDFNKIFASKKLTRASFFKGDYSGYKDGLDSGNKGNAFEQYFIDNYKEKFEEKIKKIHPYKILLNIEREGGKNSKRPLTFSANSITCGNISNNNFNIGATVTDVTLTVDNKEKIFLSLKSTETVTFVNSGIKTLFTKKFFENEEQISKNAKLLLDMLCIDENRFKNIFNNYINPGDGKRHKNIQKDIVNITNKLKHNDIFKKFMKSVMGYGFILVHQIKNDNIEYINLEKDTDLIKYIDDIKNAYIEYPLEGKAKRINVKIEYENIIFNINIRAKDGEIFPSHIMADYKFINN